MNWLVVLLIVVAGPVQAAWTWSEAQTINSARGAAIFLHLESANRQSVAVSGGTVGVVWEDNRDGSPQCYLSTKPAGEAGFLPEVRLSRSECYEPVLVALGAGRFVAAWEESGRVQAQILPGGSVVELSAVESAQITLATGSSQLFAAWAEQSGQFRRIVVARLVVSGDRLSVRSVQPVESRAPINDQSWPALALTTDGRVTVAWEDRRDRHTVPMVSHSRDGRQFESPMRLSDLKSGSVKGLGAGTGAMRPTLTQWGARGMAAVWLDKRDFLSGYDVYAALDSGTRRFGRNLRVQDSFGDNMAQWHAKGVGDSRGRLLVVWDDARDGTPDVWMAAWNGKAFGDTEQVPPASGVGAQSDPIAALDEAGNVHLVWLDRDDQAVTHLRYARGVPR